MANRVGTIALALMGGVATVSGAVLLTQKYSLPSASLLAIGVLIGSILLLGPLRNSESEKTHSEPLFTRPTQDPRDFRSALLAGSLLALLFAAVGGYLLSVKGWQE